MNQGAQFIENVVNFQKWNRKLHYKFPIIITNPTTKKNIIINQQSNRLDS